MWQTLTVCLLLCTLTLLILIFTLVMAINNFVQLLYSHFIMTREAFAVQDKWMYVSRMKEVHYYICFIENTTRTLLCVLNYLFVLWLGTELSLNTIVYNIPTKYKECEEFLDAHGYVLYFCLWIVIILSLIT